MKRYSMLELAVLGASLLSSRDGHGHEPPGQPRPPKADVIPKRLELFDRVRTDPYFWLSDRKDPKVKAYLEAENAYTDALMAHTKALQHSLYDEIVGRIKQADATAPVFDNGYYYYSRYETGKQYPILVRKQGSLEAAEEVLLDENALAAGHGYFSLAHLAGQSRQPQARVRSRHRRPAVLYAYASRISDWPAARRHDRRRHVEHGLGQR